MMVSSAPPGNITSQPATSAPAARTDTVEIRTLRRGTDTVRSSNTNSFSHPHILVLDSGTFLLSPVGSCVRFTCEKQGVGLGWGNLLIAVRFWLNFRIPTVAFSAGVLGQYHSSLTQ